MKNKLGRPNKICGMWNYPYNKLSILHRLYCQLFISLYSRESKVFSVIRSNIKLCTTGKGDHQFVSEDTFLDVLPYFTLPDSGRKVFKKSL